MITAEDKQAAEQQVLEDAQRRLEEKRAAMPYQPITPVKETVEARLERLREKMRQQPSHLSAPVSESAVIELREKAGIPPRHRIEIPDGESPWHEKRAAIVKQLGNGFIIALSGIQGTGKTQMSSAVIYAATAKKLTCKFATALEFFIGLQDRFDDQTKSQASLIASFVKPKLLVLDEMDERSESAWENRLLFHMINQRYNNLVDTVLISRKPENEFLNSLGASVTSRIQETGGSIVCTWGSYREERV